MKQEYEEKIIEINSKLEESITKKTNQTDETKLIFEKNLQIEKDKHESLIMNLKLQ